MKYLGYAVLLLAFLAGFYAFPMPLVIVFALISTLIFAASRRKTLKETPMAPDQNMLLDGAFLFALQVLIMFVTFLLGVFAASAAGDSFIDFMTGNR
jgi:uncharacterized membrane protein